MNCYYDFRCCGELHNGNRFITDVSEQPTVPSSMTGKYMLSLSLRDILTLEDENNTLFRNFGNRVVYSVQHPT